jgi:hypothetical protein
VPAESAVVAITVILTRVKAVSYLVTCQREGLS